MTSKIIVCAKCGNEIPVGEEFYSVDDNFWIYNGYAESEAK